MDRDEVNRYVPSRISLWCPICCAEEGKPCKEIKGRLAISSHNAYATGTVPRSQVKYETERQLRNQPPRWEH